MIRVEAFADPAPPVISREELDQSHEQTMKDLAAQLSKYSERELVDMVYRRMSFYLCAACYRPWIEDPTG